MQIEKNEKGNVKFLDTKGMTYDTWQKIFLRFNYLGYGLHDVDDVKRYIERGVFLQPDQSKEVLIILGKEHSVERYTEKRIKSDNEKAKKFFGLTCDFELAGYLLTDGDMLNFSYQGYQRDRDHREISQVIKVDSEGYSAGLIQFVSYGNIRMLRTGFEVSKKPTEAQRRVLANYIRRIPELYVDIANNDGHVVHHIEYQMAFPSQVFNAIDEYFESLAV